jgi:signal transduction histidine kinase
MSTVELLRRVIVTEQDVFAVRHQARQLALRLGLSGQDQIRFAAALSEVGRRLLGELAGMTVHVTLTDGSALAVRTSGAGEISDHLVEQMDVTRRLVDFYEVDRTPEAVVVTLARNLPVPRYPDAGEIESIRREVKAMVAGTPLEELAEHNRQLLSTVEVVQAQRDEVLRANRELAETNRGVMALYTELSDELEATNRGVVALYAELDQRTTQARAANEAKTRFLANVSHELRAPVTAIVGLVRLIRDPASDPLTGEQDSQMEFLDASARTLLSLVNDLLDLAKAESGKLEPALEPVALADIFATLSGTMRAVPRSDSTVLVVEQVLVPEFVTDPILLTQVLRNLVTNGLKFTSTGEVRLSAHYDAPVDEVVLEVSDTGIGIPAEEQERVFEEFHQVRQHHRPGVTGTGLGLPYARRLVHALGGVMTLSSEPGRGSTFTVRLPVCGPSTQDTQDTQDTQEARDARDSPDPDSRNARDG